MSSAALQLPDGTQTICVPSACAGEVSVVALYDLAHDGKAKTVARECAQRGGALTLRWLLWVLRRAGVLNFEQEVLLHGAGGESDPALALGQR